MSQETEIGQLNNSISDEDSKLVDSILNDLNKKEGYDFTSTSAFNKTHSFCLMTKVIY